MKAVCLISGGMDSSTLAYVAKDMGYDILALHTNYGQLTEAKELECAKKIAESLGALEFMNVSFNHLQQFGKSSLTDKSITVHDYEEDTSSKSEEGVSSKLPNTYVPFRNSNLLSIAVSYAETRNADAVFIGVQSSDYSGYPDCRPEYIKAFQKVIDLGTAETTHIRLMTPFVNKNKTEILRTGLRLGVPYEHTWSCYRAEKKACGKCDSCHFRLAAFKELGIEDPIQYED